MYNMKSAGVYEFTVYATRQQFNVTAAASVSVNVLDRVSGLRLTARQPHAVLHTDSTAASLVTDPVSFTARCRILF